MFGPETQPISAIVRVAVPSPASGWGVGLHNLDIGTTARRPAAKMTRPTPNLDFLGGAVQPRQPVQRNLDSALRVVAGVLILALIVILTFVPLSQNDFWLQAAVGRIIVQTGDIPRTVLFPFTWAQNNAFYPHEWLPSVGFHLLIDALGYDRLLFVLGGLGLLLLGLSFALAFRLSRSLGAALLFSCMAMAVANYRHFMRPEIFALVLFVLTLHCLTGYQRHRDRRRLLWCLPLAIVWANSHGSFVLGPIVASIFAFGEAIEEVRLNAATTWTRRVQSGAVAGLPYLLAALAMTVVSLVNPLGVEVFRFVWAVSSSGVFKAGIAEWQPTFSNPFMTSPGFWIFMGCLAVTLTTVVAYRRRLTATDLLLLLAFLLIAATRLRYIVWFGFVAMLVCSRLVGAGAWRPAWERATLIASTAAAAIGLAMAVQFGNAYRAYPYFTESVDLTEPMINFLSKEELKGNVFNSYELGAELIYRAYPRLRPSMDSRADSYGEAYFVMQLNFLADEKALSAFTTDFDVRYMLLLWRDFELLKKMPSLRANWKLHFADHKAVLLVREPNAAK
jgi:hypothetical protein